MKNCDIEYIDKNNNDDNNNVIKMSCSDPKKL